MLRRLKYKTTFATTGRTLEGDITFQKGFGTITGPNEAGKSFVIEMVRWVLFGSAALRGTMSDYKTLTGTLSFKVRDKSYTVERTKTNAKLTNGDDKPLAAGTAPVNAKVVEILGFGLPVFDVACVANQGDLERLGNMKPTERKRMVDSVLGLGVIDDLAKWAGEEARQCKRAAADAERFLTEPSAPAKPEGYQPSTQLDEKLAKKESAHAQILKLSGKLVDTPCPTPHTIEELRVLAEDQRLLESLIRQYEQLPPPPTISELELQQLEQDWAEYDAWVSRPQLTKPSWSKHQLDEQEKLHKLRERWQIRSSLEARIEQLEAHQLECPACRHRWSADDKQLTELRDRLAQFSDVSSAPDQPSLSRGEIQAYRRGWELWDLHSADNDVDEVDLPRLSRTEIREAYKALGFETERQRLEQEIGGRTPDNSDYHQMITNLSRWQESEAARKEIANLTPQAEGLAELRQLAEACRLFDQLFKQYTTLAQKYLEQLAQVKKLKDEGEQWGKVQAALVTLRAKVKQHFVPSLNKVASHFLQQMTGGDRQKVSIDEEFNIEVDGQGLNTLSGSGMAVANLAIRLGLGQVLTNNIFSLFVGDEIDASMDKNRADNTSRVLHTLKSRIYQILLVTHKYPAADYYIHVGDPHERSGESSSGRA